ncbi:MAG: hypothetical protein OEY39_04050 [Candidatus Bathyarchaeota archaeon]|nr:hypothetical protein [Candidatus Bathyarchaeota archaeon]MDH5623621.1 hypothetical protein [Candidatus Bathyarchaeota archaeon]MDH5636232.1 hypothetical protein [Candidatus Bathyarchaeota archaeon]MDH5701494.1 hypothetical protein [Candidatus Bathyarchaeota archaeon]
MKCRICNKEAVEKYCELHEKAYRSIVQKYEDWKRAMDISYREYLNEILKNSYTGSWAKEVVEKLMKDGDR